MQRKDRKLRHHVVGFVSRVDAANKVLLASNLTSLSEEIMQLSDQCNYDNEID